MHLQFSEVVLQDQSWSHVWGKTLRSWS